jgi:hypothetical protein
LRETPIRTETQAAQGCQFRTRYSPSRTTRRRVGGKTQCQGRGRSDLRGFVPVRKPEAFLQRRLDTRHWFPQT